MHNSESVRENQLYKMFLDFEIQADPLISARRPKLMTVNKKENLPISELYRPG